MLCRVNSAHYRGISQCSCTSDDAFVVTCGDDGVVRVWSVASLVGGGSLRKSVSLLAATKKPLHTLHKHTLPVTCTWVSKGLASGARVFSGGRDRFCHIWELGTGLLLGSVSFEDEVLALAVDVAECNLFVGLANGVIHRVCLHDAVSMQCWGGEEGGHVCLCVCVCVQGRGLLLFHCLCCVYSGDGFLLFSDVSPRCCFCPLCIYFPVLLRASRAARECF